MSDHDTASGTEETSESEVTRPNCWNGPNSTWYSLTEQERGLAASLDELRNRDLSVHLYNAHALKRRAREFESGAKASGDLLLENVAHDVGRTFVPSRVWTAWPLPPGEVPREGEIVGPEDPDDVFTYKSRQVVMPSWPLEENLLATILRFAKERFQAREWAEQGLQEETKKDHERNGMTEGSINHTSKFQREFDDDNSIPSDHDVHGTAQVPVEKNSRRSESTQRYPSQDEGSPRYRFKSVSPKVHLPTMRPVISADDERSHRLLRPSIRHTLFRLDEVLIALHHARKVCHQYASQSEVNTGDDSIEDLPPRRKRPRGRPRKVASLPERLKGVDNASHRTNDPELLTAKKSRGRPKKHYERLEGETEEEYLIRVARIQKKALPAFAISRQSETPESSQQRDKKSRGTRSPRERTTPEAKRAKRQRKLGARDWSEVVGLAAIVGFSPEVIARTTQRCATLFTESMMMRALVEAPFAAKDSDNVTLYQPEEIPALGPPSPDPSEMMDNESSCSHPIERKRSRSASRPLPEDRTHLHSWFCPIDGCLQNRGLRFMSHLKRHLRQVHKLSEKEVEGYFPPSDEEMDGAVHVDGFMRPIKNKRGQRGKDTVKSRKQEQGRGAGGNARVEEDGGMDEERDYEEQVGGEETVLDSKSSP